MKERKNKGEVGVSLDRDRLRLNWRYAGKRYYLYLGLPDTRINRIVAEGKARMIEGDMATGNFDPTLAKYKPVAAEPESQITADELFAAFMQERSKSLYDASLEKYRITHKHLQQFFPDERATRLTERNAEQFRSWLSQRMQPITLKERFTLLVAAWQWGIKQKLVEENPWLSSLKRIRVPPKQRVKPFTREEIRQILEGFRSDRYYAHYADFVEFLLGTGCRTGEAIGLRWGHISDDFSSVWIGESMSRTGERKATKTNQARDVPLTERLQAMLKARRPAKVKVDDLVFPAPKGGAIDGGDFRNRAWKAVLTKMNVPYRKPYTTRSTLISHALAQGLPVAEVAELTGHDPAVLYKHYLGSVASRSKLPDLLGDN